MMIHQSDLQSFNRCGEAHRRELNGQRGPILSATAYGSVIHHALHTLERTLDLQLALNTFDHYWHPMNIDAIAEGPVEEWIARDSYGGLRTKGMELLKRYYDLVQYREEEELLALEFPFAIPLPFVDETTGEPHILLGTVDRLALRLERRKLAVEIDDWKSGRKKSYLRNAIQWTGYAWASTSPLFWTGNPAYYTEGFGTERGTELFERLAKAERHGWWIDVSGTTPKWNDCGPRVERDFIRFFRVIENYVAARRHNIFPLAYEGEVCQFCTFRDTCPEGIDPA